MSFRILVCGGRSYSNAERLKEVLDAINARVTIDTVIHGAARGADALADAWARAAHCDVLAFPAAWDKHGKAAGPIRNRQMLERGEPDLVIAFPGGSGTENMCAQALSAGIQVLVVE